eukprot:13353-Heterococcus_DN1.PRE.2
MTHEQPKPAAESPDRTLTYGDNNVVHKTVVQRREEPITYDQRQLLLSLKTQRATGLTDALDAPVRCCVDVVVHCVACVVVLAITDKSQSADLLQYAITTA